MNKVTLLNKYTENKFSVTVLLFVGLIFTSFFLVKNANALDVNCQIPNAIICEVTDPDGFMAVRVDVDFGELGVVAVTNHTFPKCVTSATVSWDPIVPNFQVFTTECSSGLNEITLELRKTRSTVPLVRAENFEIEADRFGRPLSIKALEPETTPLGPTYLTSRVDRKEIYETDCEWTNDNVAQCLVYDCDADGVCVEIGDYCVDKYGNDVPCP